MTPVQVDGFCQSSVPVATVTAFLRSDPAWVAGAESCAIVGPVMAWIVRMDHRMLFPRRRLDHLADASDVASLVRRER